MQIEQLRQEINELLENIMKHSNSYSEKEHLIALDVNVIQQKVNKLQEQLTIFKYLLEQKHDKRGLKVGKTQIEPIIEIEATVTHVEPEEEEPITDLTAEIEIITEKEEVSAPKELKEIVERTEIPKVENIELPITKLSEGLTLNDRYLYANELFSKDMNAFNDLVKAIDECANLDEAVTLYMGMNWELDNEHVVSFTNLVERRFS